MCCYSNDGSAQTEWYRTLCSSITNHYSLTIITPIFTESGASLQYLFMSTLDILPTAPRNECTPESVLSKIKVVMTDNTSHNLNVVEKVCEEYDLDLKPSTLLGNAHPLVIFQERIKKVMPRNQRLSWEKQHP